MEERVGDFGDEGGDLFIGQVAVLGGDALFDGPGAFGIVGEEEVVVVGFDEERVEVAEFGGHAAGDVAGVGEHAEGGVVGVEDESDWVDGVVLDGEGIDVEVFDGERLAWVEGFPLGVGDGFADHVGGGVGGEDRDGEGFQEGAEAIDVVAVFVGEEDGVDGFRGDADLVEAELELAGGEAGINEDADVVAIDHCGIAATAATEHCEPHGGGSWAGLGVAGKHKWKIGGWVGIVAWNGGWRW